MGTEKYYVGNYRGLNRGGSFASFLEAKNSIESPYRGTKTYSGDVPAVTDWLIWKHEEDSADPGHCTLVGVMRWSAGSWVFHNVV